MKIESQRNMLNLRVQWRCDCGASGEYGEGEYRNAYEAHPECKTAPANFPQVATPEGDKAPAARYATPITDRVTDSHITPEPVRKIMWRMEQQRAQLIDLLADVVQQDQAALVELARLGMPLSTEAVEGCGKRQVELAKYRLQTLD